MGDRWGNEKISCGISAVETDWTQTKYSIKFGYAQGSISANASFT